MAKKHGSLIGGMLLLAGSCIGAGMLALPIVTGLSGYYPSLIAFFAIWAFMTISGLYLVEAGGWFSRKANLITMVGKTLGRPGKVACWVLYLFLFYSILLAYISLIGSLFGMIMNTFLGVTIPDWFGSLIFVILFGWIVYLGTRPVDMVNRVLMVGKIGAFLTLVFLGVRFLQPALLERSNPDLVLFALPVLVIAFGFQNMIPSLSDYLGGDQKRSRNAILLGGIFTLTLYMIWQTIALGIIPFGGEHGILATYKTDGDASQSIVGLLGASSVGWAATFLAFFAILTSFLAQALALSHFLGDGLKAKIKEHEDGWLVAITLIPPLLLAILYSNVFLKALDFAGGICAVALFGVLPPLMVWKGRYTKKYKSNYQVFGGKGMLCLILFVAFFIAAFQLSKMFGAPYIPKL